MTNSMKLIRDVQRVRQVGADGLSVRIPQLDAPWFLQGLPEVANRLLETAL